ncbi:MAG: glycosyltransferase family A protein [Terriglobales bacterium]|jgi:glycosyltransferase involved in cell wall biosynthesis
MQTAESSQAPQVSTPAPTVSVIIPSYKTAGLITACLDSVFAQTYKDFEAIVVNDGSPDTVELEKVLEPYLSRYLDRIIYLKQENKRAAGARNNAIQHARGEFVAFLDSDDTWMPDHLASQMQLFAADPSLGLTYSNGWVGLPGEEREFMERCPSAGEATFGSLLVERCQIPISTVVARKQAIVKAGMFDEKLARCDDYDMWVRTAFHGAKIAYSRKLQAHMPVGRPGSLSQSRAKMAEGYSTILEKYKQTLPLKDADRQVVEKRAAEIRARYLLEEGKNKLEHRQFAEARKLIAEANGYFHKLSLSWTLFGLSVAPGATWKLISLLQRIRHGSSA